MDRASPPVMPGPELAGTELLFAGKLAWLVLSCLLLGGWNGTHRCLTSMGLSCRVWTAQQLQSDWNVCQIDRLVVHQIELRARLGQRAVRLHAWARLADWVLFQIGQIGVRTRLPDRRFRQIGVVFAQTLVRALPKQDARLSSMPDCRRWFSFPFEGFCQIGLIGFIFGPPDWIRLGSVPDCQILPDWARQIGARLTSTGQ